jgi:signal transduction histidine kinase/ActR/RegA family two-component response regulator
LIGADGVWWMRTAPLRTHSGKVYAGLAIATDVTDRRVAELRRLQLDARLERARRLEAVGKMAGGVAHDFNNLLAVVMNYADFIAEALPGDSPHHEDLAEISRAAERGASLTRQLLIFSGREVATPGRINLNQILVDVDKLLHRTLGEDVNLEIVTAADLHPVEADPGQIEQVLVGMAMNAREAMPEGGSLRIETDNVEIGPDEADGDPQVGEGLYARMTLSDTGAGIPAELVGRIFEPFFTTKGRGDNTGLGLAAVHGVIANAGGYVTVRSEEGVGSTFHLYFPAVGSAERPALDPVADRAGAGQDATSRILLAEDDDAMRKMAARVLGRASFEVVACEDGQAAIELLEQGQRFGLLLTDVVMPRVSGRELADKAHEIDPRMVIVFMSGYTEEVISTHDVVEGDVKLLRKPFSSAELLEFINRALGTASGS